MREHRSTCATPTSVPSSLAPRTSSLDLRPLRAAGPIFERDFQRRQPLADLVGGGEIFVLASRGSQVDQQAHQSRDQRVVARRFLFDRLAEQPERAGQFAERARDLQQCLRLLGRRLRHDFEPFGIDKFIRQLDEAEKRGDRRAGVEIVVHAFVKPLAQFGELLQSRIVARIERAGGSRGGRIELVISFAR